MVPWVGGVSVKASRPKQDFVFVVHAVLVIIFVKVVTDPVVVVVKRCDQVVGGGWAKFCIVGQPVAVPIIVCPVHNTVVVVIPSGLFFAPETSREAFLVNVQATVVVVIGVFAVWNTVVVVVNVVNAGGAKALRHDTAVPNGLVEAVVVGVSIVSIVIVVVAVGSGKEIPVVLTGVVVKVEVAVNLKEIPDAVVIVIHVKPIEDGVVIIVQINGGVGEIAVDVAVNIVLEEVSTQFIGEIRFWTVVAVPLPNAGEQTNPCDVSVSVVGHLGEGDAGVNGTVATEIVVPASNPFDRCAAPIARGSTCCGALVKGCVGTGGIRCTELGIDAVQGHLVGKGISVAANESGPKVPCSPATG